MIAEQGAVALQQLQQHSFDIVLMDCQMPVMDGYSATEEIRRHPRWDNLPVIAMTANAMRSDYERAMAVGMNDYLTKPIAPVELYSMLAKWLPDLASRGLAPAVVESVLDAEPLPNAVTGLDIEAGLRYLGGKQQRYLKLLAKFKPRAEELRLSCLSDYQRGELQGAVRAAHTLKGLAATLGAVKLSLAAEQLEQALRRQAWAEIEPMQQQLQQALAEALVGVEQLLSR